jgi:hypothetical protein
MMPKDQQQAQEKAVLAHAHSVIWLQLAVETVEKVERRRSKAAR